MDKLKLRYLIREAIENVANVTSKFSVGDKVTTVDGDTANVTMAEHPFYTVELESTGTTKSYSFSDLAPYEEKIIAKTSEGISLQEGINASPGLLFHQNHNRSLSECIFRIGSKSYVEFYSEARELFNEGVLIFMLSLSLVLNELTLMLWVFFVSQLFWGLYRSWEHGREIDLNQHSTIEK